MLACLWVGVSRSSFLVVGVLVLFGVDTPTALFCLWCVFGGCGVTPRFLCVYGALAVKGSQRHACR